ncbi:Bcr/CflA family efflux MFS transporter [Leucothrix sargassi]|nr:Bcr/CflA family efflux MFS transporter [Leucothrix sargassi]
MALTMSIVALSIDSMLPALSFIGNDLMVTDSNDTQLIISMVFMGLAGGQLIFGPLSDSIGRKPALYFSLLLFSLGCLLSIFATDMNTMLVGRLLQGLGAAGPKVVSVAVIRDQYEGREMAKVMSLIMMVFILVPMLAPFLGQLVLYFSSWRGIFVSFLLLAIIIFVWFGARQPETLLVENRQPFTVGAIKHGFLEVCKNRVSLGYTLAVGVISGPFMMYLSTAQPILEEQYALGAKFTIYFACFALSIGIASYVNAKLVIKHGMRRLSYIALVVVSVISLLFCVPVMMMDGQPPLILLMIYSVCTLFCMGMLFGNMNTMAMEPVGHIAGMGAAVVGAFSTFISAIIAMVAGSFYDNSVLPLVLTFGICAVITIGLMKWADKDAS